MPNRIIIFTLNGCGHCSVLKGELNNDGIEYTEIEVSKHEEIWNQVVKQTGHNILPTVFISINGEDDGPVFVPGRDYQDKDEIVKIIKTYI
jgi:glutaredoxin